MSKLIVTIYVNLTLLFPQRQVFDSYEALDEVTIRQLFEADPYWQNGIWIEYKIKAWIQAF